MLAANLCGADIERYRATRPPRTLGNELGLLFSALKAAKRRGEAVPDLDLLRPARRRKEPEQRDRWLSQDEADRLAARLSPERRDWVWLACHTGLRLAEVNALRWEHVDLEHELLHAPGTKTKRSRRVVPLSNTAMIILQRRKAEGLPPVSSWPRPHKTLHRAAQTAGIEDVIPHDFRRTFASWLLQRGVSHHAIADLLGHQGMQLVRSVYAHLGSAELRAAVKMLRV